jgi:hypothetical protein
MAMQVTVQVPDEIAEQFGEPDEMRRHILESWAAEGYRARSLSRRQVSQLLALDYWQTEEFLTKHEAKRPYTLADLEIDRRSLARLPEK